jgi:hypothetical protein
MGSSRGLELRINCREFKRGFAPLQKKFPLPLNKGKGIQGMGF